MAHTVIHLALTTKSEPSLAEVIDSWALQPQRVLMHPDDFRDILIWGLVEEGMSEAEARREADLRMASMQTEHEIRTS